MGLMDAGPHAEETPPILTLLKDLSDGGVYKLVHHDRTLRSRVKDLEDNGRNLAARREGEMAQAMVSIAPYVYDAEPVRVREVSCLHEGDTRW